LLDDVEYFPLSARTGKGAEALLEKLLALLPEGPPYYPKDVKRDVPDEVFVAELVREKLVANLREELPHAVACKVTEWDWPHIKVEIIVERSSQKAIVIGKGGQVLKDVGTGVRKQLPEGAFIELFVKVEKHWQDRPESLDRLGY
jgi:GTP-binding protein Era